MSQCRQFLSDQGCCFPCGYLCEHWNRNVNVLTNSRYWLNRKLSYYTFRQVMHIPTKWHFYFTIWTWYFSLCLFLCTRLYYAKTIYFTLLYIPFQNNQASSLYPHRLIEWCPSVTLLFRSHIPDGTFPLDNWIRWTLRSLFSHGWFLYSHETDLWFRTHMGGYHIHCSSISSSRQMTRVVRCNVWYDYVFIFKG